MTVLVTDTPLRLVTQYDVSTQADSTFKAFGIVKADVPQGMFLLPFDKEEEKQTKKILW